eukprot:1705064-Prymnesium_polylepis.1
MDMVRDGDRRKLVPAAAQRAHLLGRGHNSLDLQLELHLDLPRLDTPLPWAAECGTAQIIFVLPPKAIGRVAHDRHV